MKKIIRLFFTFVFILFLSPVSIANAADNKEVTGKLRYDYAFKVLEIVNKERASAGIASVEMDASLLDSAMARAAEITVLFDHTRPNGETCFTINEKMFGENIAWGQKDPSAVMKTWMNSQGHKENILDKSYKSIGIGCIETSGGIYWVQCFGFDKATAVKEPASGSAKYQVAINKSGETKLLKGVDATNAESTTEKVTPEETTNGNEITDNGNVNTNSLVPSKISGFKTVSAKKKVTLKWKKANVDGYKIQISDKKNFAKADSYYISSSINKLTLKKYRSKKLKSKKKYYVRIRSFVYVDDIMTFGKWKKSSVKTK